MAKTLRTSGDYTIKTGTGAGGSNWVNLDSSNTRIMGNLTVDGTRTELNTASLNIEDSSIFLGRNNSGADVDSGIMINRDGQTGYQPGNNVAIYWNEGDNVFKLVATTSSHTDTAIVDTALATLQVAEPSASSDVATKNYVDAAGGAVLTGSTNNQVTTVTGANAIIGEANLTFDGTTLQLKGALNVVNNDGEGGITIDDNKITTNDTNTPLEISASGSGNVVINGINFLTSGEMISKSEATALAIALG